MELLKQKVANDNKTNVFRLADRKIWNTKDSVSNRTNGLLVPNLGITDKELKELLALGSKR
jgi:hypothetical protein